mmetsp:Transcript_11765/g.29000  ORF Transcript_11765/g.29000 Transcript_11765/m.29000 type:complete len:80 (+) Transcript_11765:542-781(+)
MISTLRLAKQYLVKMSEVFPKHHQLKGRQVYQAHHEFMQSEGDSAKSNSEATEPETPCYSSLKQDQIPRISSQRFQRKS